MPSASPKVQLILLLNRIGLLFIGGAYAVIATAGALREKPAAPLILIGLLAACAIAYSVLQNLPPLAQRLFGIGANGGILVLSLTQLLLTWQADGPSLGVPAAATGMLALLGVPFAYLLRGDAPPSVWRRRA